VETHVLKRGHAALSAFDTIMHIVLSRDSVVGIASGYGVDD
jgi:hypothetical protein